MQSGIWAGGFLGAIVALSLTPMYGYAAQASPKNALSTAETVRQVIDRNTKSVQLVTFPDTKLSPVKVMRGGAPAKSNNAQTMRAEKAEAAEIVTFSDPQQRSVKVMRGETDRAAITPRQPRRETGMKTEIVSFADPRDRPVSIIRGSVSPMPDSGLFGPAAAADLDRVAFAVEGAESSHGADLRMWRPEPSGTQGPMQITAAAAMDVGSGDRFGVAENRVLGRAYLARMYRRYGNWPDAIAAYNWGPGNVDLWISGGRAVDKPPLEVERYRDRVLRDAALAEPAAMPSSSGWPLRPAAARAPASE
jgi:hypothetical protein